MRYLGSNSSDYSRKFVRFMGQSIAGVTSSFRFPSQKITDIKALIEDTVPLLDCNYLSLRMSSLYPEETTGNVSPEEVRSELDNLRSPKMCSNQTPDEEQHARDRERPLHIPPPHNNKATSLFFCPAPGYDRGLSSCSFLANLTSIRHTFDMIFGRFDALYKRKSFVHFYESVVDEEMFLDA